MGLDFFNQSGGKRVRARLLAADVPAALVHAHERIRGLFDQTTDPKETLYKLGLTEAPEDAKQRQRLVLLEHYKKQYDMMGARPTLTMDWMELLMYYAIRPSEGSIVFNIFLK